MPPTLMIAPRRDLLASVVVFLVALPLCMGVAIASGVPPAAGLVTGIIGGLVVGAIAGAPLQVSGPAAGLTVLVWEIVQTHGIEAMAIVVVLAGAMQIVAGALRLGGWFRAVSPAVVHGMLAGIGVLIMASQIHIMVDDRPKGSGLANLISTPEALWKGVVPMDASTHHLAAAIGLLTIAVIVLWTTYRPARLAALPAPLVAVATAALIAGSLGLPIQYVRVPESLLGELHGISFSGWGALWSWALAGEALALAAIASAETLLCATAVDQMHDGPRTDYDRELVAQGVGNTLCGLLGALPMTGVIVRSSANIEAGARTRWSAILHGGWLLAFVLLVPGVLEGIPTASLAAVLVFTGYKLLNPAGLRRLMAVSRSEAAIGVATVVAIVATNLLEGIAIGFGLSVVKLVYTLSHLEHRQETGPGDVRTIVLGGCAIFLSLPRLARLLEDQPPHGDVHVRFERMHYVDHACLDLLERWAEQRRQTGNPTVIVHDSLYEAFHRSLPSHIRRQAAERAATAPEGLTP